MDCRSNRYFVFFLALATCLFLYATKNHMPFFESIDWVDAHDVYSYLKMSTAAPGFSSENISYHFAQRFIPHYLVGSLAYFFHLGVDTAYIVVNALIVFFILFFSWKVIAEKVANKQQGLLWFLLLALSPFSFRLNIFVPGLLADLVFVLGFAMALDGLFNKHLPQAVLGMLLAASGKQMALLVLPGVLLYAFLQLKKASGRLKALLICAGWAAAVIVFNKILALASSSFANPNSLTSHLLLSFFPWLVSDKFSMALLAEHLFRIFIPSAPFLILISMLGTKDSLKRALTGENLALLLMVLGPSAYAFLPGPLVQVGNQSRYIASAMLPILLFAARVLPSFEVRFSRGDIAALSGFLLLFTYHHRYCLFPSEPKNFMALHLVSLSFFALWLWVRRKKVFIPLDR